MRHEGWETHKNVIGRLYHLLIIYFHCYVHALYTYFIEHENRPYMSPLQDYFSLLELIFSQTYVFVWAWTYIYVFYCFHTLKDIRYAMMSHWRNIYELSADNLETFILYYREHHASHHIKEKAASHHYHYLHAISHIITAAFIFIIIIIRHETEDTCLLCIVL